MNNYPNQLDLWHRFVETKDAKILSELIDENADFHSPFVWKPKHGKQMTTLILRTAAEVFEDFRYVREIFDGKNWVLEFEAKIGELTLRGVDLIQFNEAGKIIDFEVMVRPANALQKLGEEMGKRMENLSNGKWKMENYESEILSFLHFPFSTFRFPFI